MKRNWENLTLRTWQVILFIFYIIWLNKIYFEIFEFRLENIIVLDFSYDLYLSLPEWLNCPGEEKIFYVYIICKIVFLEIVDLFLYWILKILELTYALMMLAKEIVIILEFLFFRLFLYLITLINIWDKLDWNYIFWQISNLIINMDIDFFYIIFLLSILILYLIFFKKK